MFDLLPISPVTGASADAKPPARDVTHIVWVGQTDSRIALLARQLLAPYPLGRVQIHITSVQALAPPQFASDETFSLRVGAESIAIRAATTWGGLHAITTLYQLASANQLLSGLSVTDAPRFSWRGLLLDVARHFMPLTTLREVVDGLAILKMNVLHLHLCDDQGFRLRSEVWPRLASEDAYSLTDMRDFVAYAADRGVRVVPEIDMPGHTNHWLTRYPEWGLYPAAASNRFGVHQACLDPTNEAVYTALESLLGEVASVFPDQYIHIGGDEVHPRWWRESEVAQTFMAEHGFVELADLQNYFLTRIHALIVALGRTPIGWDEVLHPQMPTMAVQNWRGATTRDRALALGQQVLVAAPYYLDLFFPADLHYQFDPTLPQPEWLALEDALQNDPRLTHIAAALAWTEQWRTGAIDAEPPTDEALLGGEACLWSELVDAATLPARLWSRLPAIAERLWSVQTLCDPTDFYRRLPGLWARLPVDPRRVSRDAIRALGLSESQASLVAWLEPIKWYARLLGNEVLTARLAGNEMPIARPYNAATPLDHCVDFLLPESPRVRYELAELDRAAVAELVAAWQDLSAEAWPEDLVAVIAAWRSALQILQAWLAGAVAAANAAQTLAELNVPYGEYMLGFLPKLIEFLKQQDED